MDGTPTWGLPLPELGATPWRDAWVDAMTTIDERLAGMRGSLYVEGNATATVLSEENPAPAVFEAVVAGPPCQFCEVDTTDGTITYLGPLDRVPTVYAAVDIAGSANRTYVVRVRLNDEPVTGLLTRIRLGPNVTKGTGAIVGFVPMTAGDTLRLWVEDETASGPVTVEDAALAVRG